MAELVRSTVREQLGANDPAASAPGVTVRLLDPVAQSYLTRAMADLAPNAMTTGDPYLLWLAADSALRVAEHARPADDATGFVSDISDGLAVFEIAGPRAADIICASCTLAPSGPELAPGRCAQTLFGGVRVILYVFDGRFRVHVERQLAAFLLEWFSQAASALG
jgi:heterotetrameric sarcosine oxidase gamma subunit